MQVFLIALTIAAICAAVAALLHLWQTRPRYLAITEYWVYLPTETMPEQDAVMTKMMTPGRPIGKKEGLLFSDVRTHFALVLRNRNPHVFRPDLFEDHIEPTPSILQSLSESKSLVKVRYASEVQLKDYSHLTFLPHAADVLAELGNAGVIYDVMAEKLFCMDDFHEKLIQNKQGDGVGFHVHLVWKPTENGGGRMMTKGLAKIGLPDLMSAEIGHDEKILVEQIFDEAVKTIWENKEFPDKLEIEVFHDMFYVQFQPRRNAPTDVTMIRVQPV